MRTSWAEIACRRKASFQSPVRRQLDLAEDEVGDAVQEVVLVGDVVVERHRLDPELLPEPAHAERVDAGLVGERDGGAQHALSVQRGSSSASRP